MDANSNGKKEYTAQGEGRTLWDGSTRVVLDNLTAVERAGYPFAFPRNRRHGGPVTQLAKMREELEEVAAEVGGGTCVDMLVETMDLIEAAEGLLRGYEGTQMLEIAWHEHYQKNVARGDYEARSWYDAQPACDGECEERGHWNGAFCTRPDTEDEYMAEYIIDCDEREFMERIVRCRDCKHSKRRGTICRSDRFAMMETEFDTVYVEPYGFCAWAEPKEVSANA